MSHNSVELCRFARAMEIQSNFSALAAIFISERMQKRMPGIAFGSAEEGEVFEKLFGSLVVMQVLLKDGRRTPLSPKEVVWSRLLVCFPAVFFMAGLEKKGGGVSRWSPFGPLRMRGSG